MCSHLATDVGHPPLDLLDGIRDVEGMAAFEAAPIVLARLGCHAERAGGYAAGAGLDFLHAPMLLEIYVGS